MNCFSKTCINIPSFKDVVIKEWGVGYIMRLTQGDFASYTFPCHKYSDSVPSCSLPGINAIVTHELLCVIFFFFLSELYTQCGGLNSRPLDQESHAPPTEPARRPNVYHTLLCMVNYCFRLISE